MKQDRNGLTHVAATAHRTSPDPALQRQIAERAYQLYQLRGGSHGCDMEDWLTAEREVMASQRRRVPTAARRGATTGRSPSRSKVPKAA
jgi:hypothetical protein